jgi:myosin heavy subunit
MKTVGITDAERDGVFSILSALLHMSNIAFEQVCTA